MKRVFSIFCWFLLIGSFAPSALAIPPNQCFPSCSKTDGRFLSIAGEDLETLVGQNIVLLFAIAPGDPDFEFGIFDGDSGIPGTEPVGMPKGMWDFPGISPVTLQFEQLEFRVFEDTNGDSQLDPGDSLVVGPIDGGTLSDNDWSSMMVANSAPVAPSGNKQYLFEARLPDPTVRTWSNFKVRVTGAIEVSGQAFGFTAPDFTLGDAEVLYPQYPSLNQTTYDGQWIFRLEIPALTEDLAIYDGDFDLGTCTTPACMPGQQADLDENDPDTNDVSLPFFVPLGTDARPEGVAFVGVGECPGGVIFSDTGCPADDQPGGPYEELRRQPSIRYQVEFPGYVYDPNNPSCNPSDGCFANNNPSGNREWERFRIAVSSTGAVQNGTSPCNVGDAPTEAGCADYVVNETYLNGGLAGQLTIRVLGHDLNNLNAWRFPFPVVGEDSASIGDRVWYDFNKDAIQDDPLVEPGINGVTVCLYNDLTNTPDAFGHGDGKFDEDNPDDELIECMVTSGDGFYLFQGLGAGDYFVDVVESTLPPGLSLTTNNEPFNVPNGGPYPLGPTEHYRDADFGYVPAPCADCRGGVTYLLLKYNGAVPATVRVEGKDGVIFPDTLLQPGEEFELFGNDKDGKLGTNITFFVNGQQDISIHTSCSQPIGPGQVVGDFLILAGESRDGGALCPLNTGCSECKGGVTELTLLYTGPDATIVVNSKDGELFNGLVLSGTPFTFQGQGKDGKMGTNIEVTINGQTIDIHTSCSQPIGPGSVFGGVLEVLEAYSKDGGLVCDRPPDGGCKECKGGVTELTLRFNGPAPANIMVDSKKGILFMGLVNPGETFTFKGADKDDKMGTNITIYFDNESIDIHTSCSQPIGAGSVFGPFVVVEAFSKDGGRICDIIPPGDAPCAECKGGVTQLTLKYNGGAPAQIRIDTKKGVVFDAVVAAGGEFTFKGLDKDDKLGTEIKVYIDGQFALSIHTSCSKPIGPGSVFGDFEVVEAFSKDGGKVCPVPPPPVNNLVECNGRIAGLTLQYVGPAANATVQVKPRSFDSPVVYLAVNPGDTLQSAAENNFTVDATQHGETELGSKTYIVVDGVLETIHTSCSAPIIIGQPAPLDSPKGAPSPNWIVVDFKQKP